jgi:F-type H+-transporting ATPase subunit delta
MSQALTLARPYARAAFSLARDHGRLSQWASLLGFSHQMAADPRVGALLGHPSLVTQQVLDLLLPPGDSDPNFRQFLALLADNGRLQLLPEIHALFEQLRADEERVLRATVTSATELDEAEVARITESLKRRFGREVALTRAIDPELLGGAVIDAGDVVIDGSLRTKLRRLETALAQ